jgi:hypothetical protein
MAMGRKINDFATASPLLSRSASVAKARPIVTLNSGTRTIQPAVFGEHEAEIVQANELLGTRVLETDQDRVDDGIDQEDRKDD